MNFQKSLAIAAVVMGLGATSVAMDHGRMRDRDDSRSGDYRVASWHEGRDHDRDDHDRKGYEKGKKTGWQNGTLPPGQAKKESKEYQREHKRESRGHRDEAREREREARENRHRSHEATVHKQEKPFTYMKQAQKDKDNRERAAAMKRAQAEHKHEAKENRK
jgi:hypothetical protein